MKPSRTYQVRDVARIAGVSVRTLHHFDAIGLLAPSSRTAAGYRLYDGAGLLRLQQILVSRELGLPLEEIRRALDDSGFDHEKALIEQRERLRERARATDAMIRAADKALAILNNKGTCDAMDMKEIFDGFDPSKFEAEAKARWGRMDAYAESAKRAKSYTAEDWKKLKEEQSAIYGDAARAMKAGKKPGDGDVMDIAERHRSLIDRWFYRCGVAMHRGLADMYEADSRFAESIDTHGAGLTLFLAEAIRANARRNGQ